MISVDIDQITGKTSNHLAIANAHAGVLHRAVVEPFDELKARAHQAGFDLKIISGYRSFSRQLGIWNAKARAERPVLDDSSKEIDLGSLTSAEKMHAILRWSALPGASRHHWGTDVDIYDAAAIGEDYQVQLTPEETRGTGPFAGMHRWLDEILSETDFYRPYAEDRGGTGPEPWHLSYAPVAEKYAKELSPQLILSALDGVEIELRESISDQIETIFRRYIQVPTD